MLMKDIIFCPYIITCTSKSFRQKNSCYESRNSSAMRTLFKPRPFSSFQFLACSPNYQRHPSLYEQLILRFTNPKNTYDATFLHITLLKLGFSNDLYLSNCLINHYAKTCNLIDAHKLFEEITDRNAVSWNCLISGYTHFGLTRNVCSLFRSMISNNCMPTHFTLATVLRACQDSGPELSMFGIQIHGFVSKTWHVVDTVVCNALVSLYGSLGLIDYARSMFDEIIMKNLVSWNSIIGVYCKKDDSLTAYEIYKNMQKQGLQASEHTFGSLIAATYNCSFGSLLLHQVFAQVSKLGYLCNLYVGSAFVSAFARFGWTSKAREIFLQMGEKNVVSMNGLMVGLVKQSSGEEAVGVFNENRDSIEISYDTYVVLLSAIAEFKEKEEGIRKGKEVHGHLIRNSLVKTKVAIENGLVNMYAKCCNIDKAHKVFEHMSLKDQVSWNSIISGFDQNGYFKDAMIGFAEMLKESITPSNFSLISSLSSCANLGSLKFGSQVHGIGIKLGVDLDVSVSNSLLKMYGDCGSVDDCWKVFNSMFRYDQVSWNSMIGSLANSEVSLDKSFGVFLNMLRSGWKPNKVTFLNILSMLSPLSVLELGKQVHALVIKHNISENDNLLDNALLTFYAKAGEMDSCESVFARIHSKRDAVSWNSMLAGYIQNNHLTKAMDFLWLMMQSDQKMDCFTFATALSACASIATLERGMEIHSLRVKSKFNPDVVVDSTLLDMYAKCGRLDYALKVFRSMPLKNNFSWNSMISGYARHGHGKKALELFNEMEKVKEKPDHVTFVGVLHACSHSGLVEQGLEYFESMSMKYGLIPKIEHYSCVVDILGRKGELDKIEDFIKRMPMHPNNLIWRTILVACSRSKDESNVNLGKQASKMLVELEPENPVNYILASNYYASKKKWNEVANFRSKMRGVMPNKEPGCSWVSLRDGVHVFIAGDRMHPERKEIYEKLHHLNQKMKDLGYVPKLEFALYDLEVENKEELLSYHSEKLAVAFVLIRSSGKLPIRIMKNLRVCGDCHLAFGYISKMVGREIILRDSNRFHHFKDGKCSCGDYW